MLVKKAVWLTVLTGALLGLWVWSGREVASQTTLFVDSFQGLGSGTNADVELGDFDLDGDLDAFFIENTTAGNSIYINQGGSQAGQLGTFQRDSQPLGDITQRDVELGDLDGDGDLDAFLMRGIAGDSQHIWLNQGGAQSGTAGQFAKTGHLVDDRWGMGVTLGDIDNDGDLDAYVARIFNPDLLYLNDGNGNFGNSGRLLDPGDSEMALLADFDGDGDLDAFVATRAANKLWINQGLSQNGTIGTFLDSGQSFSNQTTLAAAAGDLDGDGDLDVVTANTLGNRVYLNSGGVQGGTEGFLIDTNQSLGFNSTLDIDLADVDGDGDLDAVASNATANRVWLNQGGIQGGSGGTFVELGQAIGNRFTEGGALGDVDQDGDIDYITATSGPSSQNRLYINQTNLGPAANWQIQTLDVRGQVGQEPAIALDQFGHPHIAYYDPSTYSGELHYMWWDGVRWHSEIVDENGHVGQYSAIAVDQNNRPHISYHDVTNRDVKYATKNGGQWTIERVETSGDTGRFTDIALSPAGQPRISYVTGGNQLKYAARGIRGWERQVVASIPMMGPQSLGLTSDGLPRISYFGGEMRLASWNGSQWTTISVDGQPGVGTRSALAIDTQDRVHIAYHDPVNNRLLYALQSGAGLTAGTISSGMGSNPFLDITTDLQDRPVVAFTDLLTNPLNLTLARQNGASGWLLETVDNKGRFKDVAVAWSGLDKAHIAYYDSNFGDLKYAFDGPDWQLEPLLTGGLDQLPTIAMRGHEPRIALRSVINSPAELFLANWSLPSWSRLSISPTLQLDYEVALAYDSSEQPHLAYYENRNVIYARWKNGGWVEEVVYSLGQQESISKKIELVMRHSGPAVVYSIYDSSTAEITVALRDSAGVWSRSNLGVNGYTEPIEMFAADYMATGDIALAYYAAAGNDLQLARTDGTTFTFNPIANNVTIAALDLKISRHYRLDGTPEPAAVAYADSATRQIRYAETTGDPYGVWNDVWLDTLNDTTTELVLTLAENELSQARVALVHKISNAIFIYDQNSGAGQFNRSIAVPGGPNQRTGLAFAFGDRERLVFIENNAAFHLFRSENWLAVPAEDPAATAGVQEMGNNRFCAFFMDGIEYCSLFADPELCENPPDLGQDLMPELALKLNDQSSVSAVLTGDRAIYGDLTALFRATAGGTHYLNLYITHEPEMTAIMVGDPVLLWDSYRTLQDFMPGLQALTEGRGAEVRLTQEMIDHAADVWSRIAAEGSPELAAAINGELAKSNGLQDYVGRSFDEWGRDIGLDPPSQRVFLPTASR